MPFATVSRSTTGWLLVVLLIISFGLGALLTMTIMERNRVLDSLHEVKEELKQEKQSTDQATESFNGCLGQLEEINRKTSDNALDAATKATQASLLASTALAQLPGQIKKDRGLAPQPSAANEWLRDLLR